MAGMNEVNALLGKGSEFEGKLTFEGTVRIDGRFKGEIFSEDTLIIGENAYVEAEVHVATVVVYGDVVGNIHSMNCVELHAPAKLRGNITTPNLQADKGVIFDGNVKMHEPEPLQASINPTSPMASNEPVPTTVATESVEELPLGGPTVQTIAAVPEVG